MSAITTRQCDAPKCDAVKGDANKWWVVLTSVHGVLITTASKAERVPPPTIDDWQRADACGEECMQKLLGNWTAAAHLGPDGEIGA